MITTDALNTQKNSAKVVVDKGADYLFPVKENHPGLLDDIKLLFQEADDQGFKGIDAMHTETVEKNGGRVERRTYALLSAEELPGIEEWSKCRCIRCYLS